MDTKHLDIINEHIDRQTNKHTNIQHRSSITPSIKVKLNKLVAILCGCNPTFTILTKCKKAML